MENHHYNKTLKNFANTNRNKATKSEACLWKFVLKAGQMMGYQFKRQRPIGNYIADFACLPLGLIIEVDGLSHETEEAEKRDSKRDADLEELGFKTVRFSSWEVLNNIGQVTVQIEDWIKENANCPPPPPRKQRKIVK